MKDPFKFVWPLSLPRALWIVGSYICVQHLKLGTTKHFEHYTNVNARQTRVDQSLLKMKQTAVEYFDWLYLEIPTLHRGNAILKVNDFIDNLSIKKPLTMLSMANKCLDKTGYNTVSEIENYGRFISFEWDFGWFSDDEDTTITDGHRFFFS